MAFIVDSRRFYCTTSDGFFGPEFASDEEGDRFELWLRENQHGDPRSVSPERLIELLLEFREVSCG